jgi:hypothetical protein
MSHALSRDLLTFGLSSDSSNFSSYVIPERGGLRMTDKAVTTSLINMFNHLQANNLQGQVKLYYYKTNMYVRNANSITCKVTYRIYFRAF